MSLEKLKVSERLVLAQAARAAIRQGSVTVMQGDARRMPMADESVHLIVTSPPYFNLKKYSGNQRYQLGSILEFWEFVAEMRKVLAECYRVLKPGGRICLNTGDICLSRKAHGRHTVLPLHAHYQVWMQELGFELLSPIVWQKISNVGRESGRMGGCLGKPYEPNAVIKSDIEWILVARKPGPYRSVSEDIRLASMLERSDFAAWMTQVWRISGASTRSWHPAPFPLELPHRLISLYSFVGDTVLDPFAGSGITGKAAQRIGRNAILIDCSEDYVSQMQKLFILKSHMRL